MTKQEKQKLKDWCRACGKFYEKSRRSAQNPELRKEIAWFHNHSTTHKALEVFSDAQLEEFGVMKHPYDKSKEKTVQQAREDKAQQAMAFNDAVYL